MFPLDWDVRKVLNTMQNDLSPQGIKMETKRTHLDLLGRIDKNQRSEGEVPECGVATYSHFPVKDAEGSYLVCSRLFDSKGITL